MVNKELKKLSRRELMDIIYQMKKNEQQMQDELTAIQESLRDKRMRLFVAGSIAEAATTITGIFETAQKTADLYLHEIECLRHDADRVCEKMVADAEQKVKDIMAEGNQQYEHLTACCQTEYMRLQQLREEIQILEQKRNYLSDEG